MPEISGNSCTAPFNAACSASPRTEGTPRTARISRLWARPRRRRRPICRRYGDPVSARPPWQRRSSLGPTATRPTTAPGAWATEASADANPWHPSAIVPETGPSPSHPSPTPPGHPQKLPLSLYQFTPCFCTFHLGFSLVWEAGMLGKLFKRLWPAIRPSRRPRLFHG